jgi:hypothetical protein
LIVIRRALAPARLVGAAMAQNATAAPVAKPVSSLLKN